MNMDEMVRNVIAETVRGMLPEIIEAIQSQAVLTVVENERTSYAADDMLSESEAAKVLNLSVHCLRAKRYGQDKSLNFYKIGKSVRYKYGEIQAYLRHKAIQKRFQPLN